jgi:hypothetical protein
MVSLLLMFILVGSTSPTKPQRWDQTVLTDSISGKACAGGRGTFLSLYYLLEPPFCFPSLPSSRSLCFASITRSFIRLLSTVPTFHSICSPFICLAFILESHFLCLFRCLTSPPPGLSLIFFYLLGSDSDFLCRLKVRL